MRDAGGDECTWTHLLLSDFFPNMDSFGKLYYGLEFITFGLALVWRIHWIYARPWFGRAKPSGLLSEEKRRPTFNAMYEMAHFLISSPSKSRETGGEACKHSCTLNFGRSAGGAPVELRSEANREEADEESNYHGIQLFPAHLPRQQRLLTRVWLGSRADEELVDERRPLAQYYRIPIGSEDIFCDKSWKRWSSLAVTQCALYLLINTLTIPLAYYTVVGIGALRYKFGPRSMDSALCRWLSGYRLFEQIFSCHQAGMFFVAFNILIGLFRVDLWHKSEPLQAQLNALAACYTRGQISPAHKRARLKHGRPLPAPGLHSKLQRLVWAYFACLRDYDQFVSLQSVLAMTAAMAGMAISQSYIRMEDQALRWATLSGLCWNLASFTYLHVVSWHLERSAAAMHQTIFFIVQHEPERSNQRAWEHLLAGFFEPHYPRSFTLGGRYVLNLRTYIKTIFSFATTSFLINRVFHRLDWERGFIMLGSHTRQLAKSWRAEL